MVFLAVSLAVLSTFLFFLPQPTLGSVFAQGLPRARELWNMYRGSGRGGVALTFLAFLPSLSGIGAERKAKLNRITPGVLNG